MAQFVALGPQDPKDIELRQLRLELEKLVAVHDEFLQGFFYIGVWLQGEFPFINNP
jgi:hypothetical protein